MKMKNNTYCGRNKERLQEKHKIVTIKKRRNKGILQKQKRKITKTYAKQI